MTEINTNTSVQDMIKMAQAWNKTASVSFDPTGTSATLLGNNAPNTHSFSGYGAYGNEVSNKLKDNVPNSTESASCGGGCGGGYRDPNVNIYMAEQGTPAVSTSFSNADPGTSATELKLTSSKRASAWLNGLTSWTKDAEALLTSTEEQYIKTSSYVEQIDQYNNYATKQASYNNYDSDYASDYDSQYADFDDTSSSVTTEDMAKVAAYVSHAEGNNDTFDGNYTPEELHKMAELAAVSLIQEGVACGVKTAEEFNDFAAQQGVDPNELRAADQNGDIGGTEAFSDMMGGQAPSESPEAGQEEGDDEGLSDEDADVLIRLLQAAETGDTSGLEDITPEQASELLSLLEDAESENDEDEAEEASAANEGLPEEDANAADAMAAAEAMKSGSLNGAGYDNEYDNNVMRTIRELMTRG